MSFPFYGITCTSCGFKDSDNVGTSFIYQGADEEEPVLVGVYCEACDRMTTACRSFKMADADYDIADIQASIRLNRSGLFWRLSKSRKAFIAEFEKELEETQTKASARARYFETHPLEMKCMECGSRSIQTRTFPGGVDDQPKAIGVRHKCGGELLIRMLGRLSLTDYFRVIYDKHGRIVHDGRKM